MAASSDDDATGEDEDEFFASASGDAPGDRDADPRRDDDPAGGGADPPPYSRLDDAELELHRAIARHARGGVLYTAPADDLGALPVAHVAPVRVVRAVPVC